MRVCVVYNNAPHYRTEIFKLIDQTFECDYIFGQSLGDIKQMDVSVLKGNVSTVKNKRWKSFYWQPGVVTKSLAKYDAFLFLGETRCVSTWLFCIKARLFHPRKRIYFWSHGWYGKESFSERLLKKVFFRLPNGGTFLYGNYAKKLMISEGFNPEKLFVIHNSLAYSQQLVVRERLSIDTVYHDFFNDDKPNLIFVGRLTSVKKLDMILKALSVCKEKGFYYNLVLVGDGVEKNLLKKIAADLKIENNVWFYGACYDEELLGRMIYNADLCVSPGNVGLTAMHSMVFGTPVITHNDFPRQMPEFEAIQEGKTGDFFKYGDVESLSDCIIHWFSINEKNRETIRQECFKEIDSCWTPYYQINVLLEHLI